MHAPRSLLEAGMTTNIALVESADLRHDHITRTEALDHFTQFELPPGRDWLTSAEVAVAFGVSQDTLKHLTADHRAELESNGLRQSTAEDFRDLQSLKLQGRPPLVFSRRATLNVAMLLRDSEVARAVRAYLLNVEEYASAETRQVAAEMETGTIAWYDYLTRQGAVEFFANGRPKRFDPEYMPERKVTVDIDPAKAQAEVRKAALEGVQNVERQSKVSAQRHFAEFKQASERWIEWEVQRRVGNQAYQLTQPPVTNFRDTPEQNASWTHDR